MWLTDAHKDFRIPTKRGKSITLIAALSTKNGLLHFKMLDGSNTNETFMMFYREMIEIVGGNRCTIIMDNLR